MMSFLQLLNSKIVLPDSNNMRNRDNVPMPVNRRTWSYWSYLSYWSIICLCMSTWSGAVAVFDLNLNGKTAIGIVIIGNLLITIFTLLNCLYGSEYHIGYSVFQRVIFGVRGAWLGVLIRTLLSVVWFAAQAWLGASCVNLVLCSLSQDYLYWENTFSSDVPFTRMEFVGFIIFLALNFPLLFIKPESYDFFLSSSSIATFIACLIVTVQTIHLNNGHAGELINAPNHTTDSLAWVYIYAVSAWYSGLIAGISNQSDFSRFNKRPIHSIVGTIIGLNVVGICVPLMAIFSTSAFKSRYPDGQVPYNPADLSSFLLSQHYNVSYRACAFFSGLFLTYSQISMCTIGNAVPGGMDLTTLFPRYINIRRGAILVFLLVWPTQPWSFYKSGATFMSVMNSFSVFLSPLVAIYITDYYIVRHRIIKLSDCYVGDASSAYWFFKGFNPRSIIVFLLGSAPGLPGLIHSANPDIKIGNSIRYYQGSFIFQFITTSVLYIAVNYLFPVVLGTRDEVDHFNTFTPEERQKWSLCPAYDDLSVETKKEDK